MKTPSAAHNLKAARPYTYGAQRHKCKDEQHPSHARVSQVPFYQVPLHNAQAMEETENMSPEEKAMMQQMVGGMNIKDPLVQTYVIAAVLKG